jgi:hypothetical protein
MTLRIAERACTRMDRRTFTALGSVTPPPRDPDEEDEDEDENAEEDDSADEPAVVREPDED